MQVLKFGGTSVANTESINKTTAIVEQSRLKSRTVIVFSALGGTTDMLIEAVKMAASRNDAYKEKLRSIEHRHLQIVRDLIPVEHQSATLSLVKKKCNDLESICEGVFLLQ